jgi:hypothetical protein
VTGLAAAGAPNSSQIPRRRSPATARLEYIHWPDAPLRRRTQTRRKKTADIVTLIEFLLEYDTAGDPSLG